MNSILRRRGIVAAVSAIVAITALAGCSGSDTADTGSDTTSSAGKLETIQPGVLRVAVTAATQPYVYQDSSGQWIGLEVDLVKDVAGRAGITKIEYVEQEFSSLLAAVANRKYDIGAACIGRTPERLKTVDYVKDYFNGYIVFIAKKGSGIAGADDLSGKRVGLVSGTVEESYLKNEVPEAQIVGFPDNNAAVQSLLSGSVDSVFLDGDPAGEYTKQYSQLEESFKVESSFPCAWPISKDDPKLEAALTKGMEDAIADGTVEKLTQKWVPDAPVLPDYQPKS